MFPANYGRAQIRKCTECSNVHHVKFNCKESRCIFCFNIHDLKALSSDYFCPIVRKLMEDVHLDQGNLIPCPECKGLGTYQKVEEVSIKQPSTSYEKRLQQWAEKVKKDPSLEKPEPMTFRHSLATAESECSMCEKQGRVYRWKFCCFWGCVQCNFSRFKQNSTWRKVKTQMKKRDVLVFEQQNCTICTEIIPADAFTYPTECGHKFHKECLLKWFKSQTIPTKTCPICRTPQQYYPADFYDESRRAVMNKIDQQMRANIRYFDENIVNTSRSRSRDHKKPSIHQQVERLKNVEREPRVSASIREEGNRREQSEENQFSEPGEERNRREMREQISQERPRESQNVAQTEASRTDPAVEQRAVEQSISSSIARTESQSSVTRVNPRTPQLARRVAAMNPARPISSRQAERISRTGGIARVFSSIRFCG